MILKTKNIRLYAILLTIGLFLSCKSKLNKSKNQIGSYTIENQELYNTIVAMDKTYFDAYNTCDLETQGMIYADDIEFYHDKSGLMTDKKELIEALKNNICGKVTRELVKGSIEVYPIKDYGAVQIGYHKFHNKLEPNTPSKPSKFIVIWHNKNDTWKISKVVSLH